MGCSSFRINLLQCGLFHWLQGNLCSTTRSMSSPSFFSHLGIHRAVFHSFTTLLFSVLLFLTYVFPKTPPAWPMGSAMSCGGSIWRQLELAVPGTRQPPATKTLPFTPSTTVHRNNNAMHNCLKYWESSEWTFLWDFLGVANGPFLAWKKIWEWVWKKGSVHFPVHLQYEFRIQSCWILRLTNYSFIKKMWI